MKKIFLSFSFLFMLDASSHSHAKIAIREFIHELRETEYYKKKRAALAQRIKYLKSYLTLTSKEEDELRELLIENSENIL